MTPSSFPRKREPSVVSWSAFALASLLAGCTGPYTTYGPYWPIVPPDLPPPRLVLSDAAGQTVDVVRTQWLIVRLPDDARSANRWSYEVGKDRVLYPSGDTPRPAPTTGGPPTETEFVFRAEGTGTTSLRFVYRDPGQPQAPPAKSLAFDVVAR
jgi:predicted secreted protein